MWLRLPILLLSLCTFFLHVSNPTPTLLVHSHTYITWFLYSCLHGLTPSFLSYSLLSFLSSPLTFSLCWPTCSLFKQLSGYMYLVVLPNEGWNCESMTSEGRESKACQGSNVVCEKVIITFLANNIVSLASFANPYYLHSSCFHDYNHNYDKIVKSDWLSTALISALIGQFIGQYVSCLSNWTVSAITRVLKGL